MRGESAILASLEQNCELSRTGYECWMISAERFGLGAYPASFSGRETRPGRKPFRRGKILEAALRILNTGAQ